MNEELATAPGGTGAKLGVSQKRDLLMKFLTMKARPHKNRMYQKTLAELKKEDQAIKKKKLDKERDKKKR